MPLKFLHIWQARNISLQQDRKKQPVCGFFFFFFFGYKYLSLFVFCVTNPMDQEYLNQLKIPTASSKNFPSRKKTDSAHLVCVHVFWEKTQKLVGKQGAKLCLSIPFCFGFGSTLDAHRNISPSIGTPLITCSQTQIVKKEKKKKEENLACH